MAQQTEGDFLFGQVALELNFISEELLAECLAIQEKVRQMGLEPRKIGEVFVERGILTIQQVEQVLETQRRKRDARKYMIPGYEIIDSIGQGGMGTVYKARQLSMDRIVAIKVLPREVSQDRTFLERFIREYKALGKLSHPNIVTAIDAGEAGGAYFYVMEFVDGISAMELLNRKKRLTERECLNICLQAARALEHARSHGIVHRDVKPGNIMITRDNLVKLCDMGLAKRVGGGVDPSLTQEGMAVGTPNYISPEQARGRSTVDTRSDIYSLGATLYHLCTGTPVFTGPNVMVVMTRHVTDPPEPPKQRVPELSDGFNAMILKMLQKRPEDRYQTPAEVIADVERILHGQPVSSPVSRSTSVQLPAVRRGSSATLRAVRGRRKSNPMIYVVAGAVAVGLLVVGLLSMSDSGYPPAAPPGRSDTDKAPGLTPQNPPDPAAALQEEFKRIKDEIDRIKFTEPIDVVYRKYTEAAKRPQFAGTRFATDFETERESWKAERDRRILEAHKVFLEELSRLPYAERHRRVEEFPKAEREFAAGMPSKAWADCCRIREEAERELAKDFDRLLGEAYRALSDRNWQRALESIRQLFPSTERREEVKKVKQRLLDLYSAEALQNAHSPKDVAEAQRMFETFRSVLGEEYSRVVDEKLGELNRAVMDARDNAVKGLAARYEILSAQFRSLMHERRYPEVRAVYSELFRSQRVLWPVLIVEGFNYDLLIVRLASQAPADGEFVEILGKVEELYEKIRSVEHRKGLAEILLDIREMLLAEFLCRRAVQGALKMNGRLQVERPQLRHPVLRSARELRVEPSADKNRPYAFVFGTRPEEKATGIVAPLEPGALEEADVVALARYAVSDSDPLLPLQIAVFLSHARDKGDVSAYLAMVPNDPLVPRLRERASVAVRPDPAPTGPTAKDLFKATLFREQQGQYELEYDFSTPDQLKDFEAVKWKGARADPEHVDGTMKLAPTGVWHFKAPFEGDVRVTVSFIAIGESFFGVFVHGQETSEGEKGLALVLDWGTRNQTQDPPNGGGLVRLIPADVLRFRHQGLPGAGLISYDVKKGASYTVTIERQGNSITATVQDEQGAKQTVTATSSEFSGGRCGLFAAAGGMKIKSFKVEGKIKPSWVKEQLRRLEK